MDWTKLNSSLIDSARYDPATGDLTVQFHQGRRYIYEGVSPKAADHFFQAESPGAYFHKYIKPNYQGDEITDEE
jgi:KTSC domain